MSETVWDRIERARERHDVLRHPFYLRWSAGELSAAELARYSGQYRHAVEAIADLSERTAAELPSRPGLAGHAEEERRHVEMWDGFVEAAGGEVASEPTAETVDCVEVWTERDGALAGLARLYAIESGQPEISATKLEGLARHYGITGEPGTRYFTVHRSLDGEHAAEGRALLSELISCPDDEEVVVSAAERAFEANWRLLDGVSP